MVDLGQKKVNSCLPFFMRQILGWRAKRSRLPYCSKRSFTFFKQQTKVLGGEQSEAVYHTAQNSCLPFFMRQILGWRAKRSRFPYCPKRSFTFFYAPNSGVANKAKPFPNHK